MEIERYHSYLQTSERVSVLPLMSNAETTSVLVVLSKNVKIT